MVNWSKYITSNPSILAGKPVIDGTRITVELIIEKLAEGDTIVQILEAHPHLNEESVFACLAYAADSLRNELRFPIAQ